MKNLIKRLPNPLIIILLISFSVSINAQDDTVRRAAIPDHGSLTDAWAIFHGAKIRFMQENLDLTEEEKDGFWPLFHEYEREKKDIMSNIIEGGPGKGPHFLEKFSDAEVDSIIRSKLEEELELISLKIEYYEKLKKVLSSKKLAHYYKIDDDFRRHLIDRMRGKRGKGRER